MQSVAHALSIDMDCLITADSWGQTEARALVSRYHFLSIFVLRFPSDAGSGGREVRTEGLRARSLFVSSETSQGLWVDGLFVS